MKELLSEATDMNKAALQVEIKAQENKVALLQGERTFEVVNNNIHLLQDDNSFSFNNAWKLKKKMFPRCSEAPFAITNKDGELTTSYENILDVMKDEFVYRLRNREIHQEYAELKELKEYLCALRLEISRTSNYNKWTLEELKKAIKKLKGNKCRDPHGHVNELYMNMGHDGLVSLLDMLNEIKEVLLIPSKLNLSNVSTIYKGKGSKQEVINLRGIFKLPIIRNLLDRLIYFEEMEQLGTSMGQFQVGNQKGRNMRSYTCRSHRCK